VCDVNGDGLINNDDLLAILSALNTHVLKNDPRDADGDGAVTIKDARLCALKCSAGYCGW
jgi:Ca2+-binding EF-hand superfamily protein